MKKFLISLDKDTHRRQLFFSQPNTEDFVIFSAINLLAQEQKDFQALFALDKFHQRYGRGVTRGEVGCTLSHLGVYQLVLQDETIQDEEFVLICEDDALFAPDFHQVLAQIIEQKIATDLILVGQSKISQFNQLELEINYPITLKSLCRRIEQTDYYYAYPYKNYFAGTVAYLIKKSAITRILQQVEQQLPYWLADDYGFLAQQCHLDIMLIRPLLCIENPQLMSNLALERQDLPHNNIQKWLKYPLKKIMAIYRNWRR